jgi:TATA-binding protein-associated factor Taf7|tara:strand:- start:226 stop:408 length:183 start_codon:yes stop_codon:yes gene_type:complete
MDEGGKSKKEKLDMEMINLDTKKRRYGIRLGNVMYLATLVDLPCIVEAMKTLDYFNFFKS